MSDLLRTSLSGLLASQRAITTTGHNIANANTDGYSRQRIELAARQASPYGNGFIGNGVDTVTVRRTFDQFAVDQLRSQQVELGRLEAFSGLAGQVDNILGDPNTGIANSLRSFFGAWQDVANDPASLSGRQLLVAQVGTLADRFRQTSLRLDSLEANANDQIRATVGQVNSIAASIARLNSDIELAANGAGGQPPNDLLDTRDHLLDQLSNLVGISTVVQDNGAVNVFVGSGQPLVIGNVTKTLGVRSAEFDRSRVEIVQETNAGPQTITSAIDGGELGGYLQFRTQVLDRARDVLGQVASGVAYAVNSRNAAGLDLTGQLGGDVFAIAAPTARAGEGNTGTVTVQVAVADVSALRPEEYVLRFDGSQWSAVTPGGQAVALAGSGTAADPFRADGLTFTMSGTANAGDRFLVRATRDAAVSLRAALTDPRGVAAAGPVRTLATVGNAGSGAISAASVVDASDPALLLPVTVAFSGPNTYTVDGNGPFTYAPGDVLNHNGWSVTLTGTPAAGDSFRIERNAGGTGDNRNALLVAGLQTAGVLANGSASVNDVFGGLVGEIGTVTRQANITRDAQAAITSDAREAVLAGNGVNLDEEAADLVRWQQSYQAAAQAVRVADEVFRTLLAATGR